MSSEPSSPVPVSALNRNRHLVEGLEMVLNSAEYKDRFRQYMYDTHCEEVVLFLERVENFKKRAAEGKIIGGSLTYVSEVERTKRLFLDPTADLQINIDANSMREFLRLYRSNSLALFDHIVELQKELLASDKLQSFKRDVLLTAPTAVPRSLIVDSPSSTASSSPVPGRSRKGTGDSTGSGDDEAAKFVRKSQSAESVVARLKNNFFGDDSSSASPKNLSRNGTPPLPPQQSPNKLSPSTSVEDVHRKSPSGAEGASSTSFPLVITTTNNNTKPHTGSAGKISRVLGIGGRSHSDETVAKKHGSK